MLAMVPISASPDLATAPAATCVSSQCVLTQVRR